MGLKNKKQLRISTFLLLGFYILLWVIIHELLISQFPPEATIPSLKIILQRHTNWWNIFNDLNFWSTSPGIALYFFFEINTVALILLLFSSLFKMSISFSKCLTVVVYAHSIFLLQHILECIFVIKNTSYFISISREHFSLFSISYFLHQLHITFNSAFNYLFEVINVFEILYWVLLLLFMKYLNRIDFKKSATLIFTSYVPIFILWVITLTFLTLLN